MNVRLGRLERLHCSSSATRRLRRQTVLHVLNKHRRQCSRDLLTTENTNITLWHEPQKHPRHWVANVETPHSLLPFLLVFEHEHDVCSVYEPETRRTTMVSAPRNSKTAHDDAAAAATAAARVQDVGLFVPSSGATVVYLCVTDTARQCVVVWPVVCDDDTWCTASPQRAHASARDFVTQHCNAWRALLLTHPTRGRVLWVQAVLLEPTTHAAGIALHEEHVQPYLLVEAVSVLPRKHAHDGCRCCGQPCHPWRFAALRPLALPPLLSAGPHWRSHDEGREADHTYDSAAIDELCATLGHASPRDGRSATSPCASLGSAIVASRVGHVARDTYTAYIAQEGPASLFVAGVRLFGAERTQPVCLYVFETYVLRTAVWRDVVLMEHDLLQQRLDFLPHVAALNSPKDPRHWRRDPIIDGTSALAPDLVRRTKAVLRALIAEDHRNEDKDDNDDETKTNEETLLDQVFGLVIRDAPFVQHAVDVYRYLFSKARNNPRLLESGVLPWIKGCVDANAATAETKQEGDDINTRRPWRDGTGAARASEDSTATRGRGYTPTARGDADAPLPPPCPVATPQRRARSAEARMSAPGPTPPQTP